MPRLLVWLAVVVGLVLALSATGVPGWTAGVVVALALALAVPLTVKRFRHESRFVHTLWRASRRP